MMTSADRLSAAPMHRTFRMPDGRMLGYADTGPADAPPIFYFHGFPGSRLEASFLPLDGGRLIGIDRPGYGLSDARPRRRLADFPRDVALLADHLGLGRFAVLGVSGGAPYACACAHDLPERVAAAALVCGLGPPEAPGMDDGRLRLLAALARRPVARRALFGLGRGIVMNDGLMRRAARYRARMPRASADRDLMHGEMGRMMLASWREAMKRGVAGLSSDARIYGTPWGWRLSDIRVPAYLWHGEADTIVPSSIGRYYDARVPGIESVFTEKDGHFSIVLNHSHDIVARLARHL